MHKAKSPPFAEKGGLFLRVYQWVVFFMKL